MGIDLWWPSVSQSRESNSLVGFFSVSHMAWGVGGSFHRGFCLCVSDWERFSQDSYSGDGLCLGIWWGIFISCPTLVERASDLRPMRYLLKMFGKFYQNVTKLVWRRPKLYRAFLSLFAVNLNRERTYLRHWCKILETNKVKVLHIY